MDKIKFKNPDVSILFTQTHAPIRVEEVIVVTDDVQLVNSNKNERPVKYGRVVSTCLKDEFLKGKIVELNPFRLMPSSAFSWKKIYTVPEHQAMVVCEKEDVREIQEQWEREAKCLNTK